MSNPSQPQSSPVAQIPRQRGVLPPELIDLFVPPLKVGAMCGAAGAFTGVGAAIITDSSLFMSGGMTGTQWAVLGTTFWFSRQIAIRALGGDERMTPFSRVQASAIASVPTGAMLGLSVRRTKTMGSSLLFCGVLAVGGQLAVNHFSKKRPEVFDEDVEGFWSKLSPLKKLSDQEYIDTMDEKILRVNADIALIDERIAELRAKQGEGKDSSLPK